MIDLNLPYYPALVSIGSYKFQTILGWLVLA